MNPSILQGPVFQRLSRMSLCHIYVTNNRLPVLDDSVPLQPWLIRKQPQQQASGRPMIAARMPANKPVTNVGPDWRVGVPVVAVAGSLRLGRLAGGPDCREKRSASSPWWAVPRHR